MKLIKILFNPFDKLSASKAFFIGICTIFLTSIIGWSIGVIFSCQLQITSSPHNLNFSYWAWPFMGLSIWIIVSLCFYLLSKIFSKSKIRIVDIFAYTAFAQFPFFIVLLFYIPENIRKVLTPPYPITQDWIQVNMTVLVYIMMGLSLLPLVWAFILEFNAIKIGANLKSWRLWTVYILGIFISEILLRVYIFPIVIATPLFMHATNSQIEKMPNASIATLYSNNNISNKTSLGMYEGKLNFPMQTLRFRLYMSEGLKAYATSPDQSFTHIPISDLRISADRKLTFTIPALSVNFEGYMSENFLNIIGTFTQNGYSVPLNMQKIETLIYIYKLDFISKKGNENILKINNQDDIYKKIVSAFEKSKDGNISFMQIFKAGLSNISGIGLMKNSVSISIYDKRINIVCSFQYLGLAELAKRTLIESLTDFSLLSEPKLIRKLEPLKYEDK